MESSSLNKRFNIVNDDATNFLKFHLSANSIDVIFTSPDPITNPHEYLHTLTILVDTVKRVLKPTGSMWVHMEDRFNEDGSLMRYPAKFSADMVNCGWILRAERIWHAPVKDQNFYNEGRVIDNNRLILDHSYCFHFTQSRYGYYNTFEDFGGQPCSIFTEKQRILGPDEYASAFSLELIKQCLLQTCPPGGTVLDPFCGSGSTGVVTITLGKGLSFIGVEKDARKTVATTERLSRLRMS